MSSPLPLRQSKSAPSVMHSSEHNNYSPTILQVKTFFSQHELYQNRYDNIGIQSWNASIKRLSLVVNLLLVLCIVTVSWTKSTIYSLSDRPNDDFKTAQEQPESYSFSPFEDFPEKKSLRLSSTHSSTHRGLKIPIPLPPQKVSVVLMNYSRPRMIKQSTLMKNLLAHPNVGEVVLLHANPKTRFEYIHNKVINVDATQENDEMGLSLRFYFCQMVKHEWVIQVDDDMEFDIDVISELMIEFNKNTKRIVGRFGRQLNRGSGFFNGYTSTNTHKQTDVVLTKLMIMERDLCSSFFEYSHVIWQDIVLDQGEGPMWNGEDIFMSLVANHVYGRKENYAMDWLDVRNAPSELKDYDFGKLDISGGYSGFRIWSWKWWQSLLRRNRHYSYRGMLWQAAESRLARLSQNGNLEEEEWLTTQQELDRLRI